MGSYNWILNLQVERKNIVIFPLCFQRVRGSSKRKRYLVEESIEDQAEETTEATVSKKVKASFPAEEICKTNRLWEQINNTHDFYDNEVEVIQDTVQQYVFSYRCVAETGPCIGISPL